MVIFLLCIVFQYLFIFFYHKQHYIFMFFTSVVLLILSKTQTFLYNAINYPLSIYALISLDI